VAPSSPPAPPVPDTAPEDVEVAESVCGAGLVPPLAGFVSTPLEVPVAVDESTEVRAPGAPAAASSLGVTAVSRPAPEPPGSVVAPSSAASPALSPAGSDAAPPDPGPSPSGSGVLSWHPSASAAQAAIHAAPAPRPARLATRRLPWHELTQRAVMRGSVATFVPGGP